MSDLISRKALYDKAVTLETEAMETLKKFDEQIDGSININWAIWQAILVERTAFKFDIFDAPPAQQWIPFTTRPCTEQEKEEHPDWDFYIDCQLPGDGDAILISTKSGYVCEDEIFCEDDCWYLDSGYVIGEEAVAWMPLPEPYKD